MIFRKDIVSDINIAYIGGGSKNWAWGLMNDLALEPQLSGCVRLYDIDIDAASKNEIIGNSLLQDKDTKGCWKYRAVTSLKEALQDADFVVISILPGTFKEMESDVHCPEKYGIYQSVGDTTGPGGMVRALRTIPMYVELAEAIKAYAPNAWVINYTNPMACCVRTLYHVFPEIKAFGCCHEVFNTQRLLADMLKDMQGITVSDRKDIKINVMGINHFTWVDQARYENIDLLPLFRRFADKYYESGYKTPAKGDIPNIYFKSGHRVQFDLFIRFGIIAAANDRHISEFLPPWYLKTPETAEKWQFGLTPVSYRVADMKEKTEKAEKLVNGQDKLKLALTEEESVPQIKALLGLKDLVTNVNIPNIGQIRNLPLGAIVESNAVFSKDSIKPLMAGQLPDEVNHMVNGHIINLETMLKASMKKDRELAFRAFLNDPLMTASMDEAKELFNEMLNNTKAYIPDFV